MMIQLLKGRKSYLYLSFVVVLIGLATAYWMARISLKFRSTANLFPFARLTEVEARKVVEGAGLEFRDDIAKIQIFTDSDEPFLVVAIRLDFRSSATPLNISSDSWRNSSPSSSEATDAANSLRFAVPQPFQGDWWSFSPNLPSASRWRLEPGRIGRHGWAISQVTEEGSTCYVLIDRSQKADVDAQLYATISRHPIASAFPSQGADYGGFWEAQESDKGSGAK